jgi:hypothetical protein
MAWHVKSRCHASVIATTFFYRYECLHVNPLVFVISSTLYSIKTHFGTQNEWSTKCHMAGSVVLRCKKSSLYSLLLLLVYPQDVWSSCRNAIVLSQRERAQWWFARGLFASPRSIRRLIARHRLVKIVLKWRCLNKIMLRLKVRRLAMRPSSHVTW